MGMAQNEHEGRVAVITGGSGAIGAAVAGRLNNAGAVVHALDIQPSQVPGIYFRRVAIRNEPDVDAAFGAVGTLHMPSSARKI